MTKEEKRLSGISSDSPLTFDVATNFQIIDMWRNKKNNDDAEQYTKIQQLVSQLKTLKETFDNDQQLDKRFIAEVTNMRKDFELRLQELEKPKSSLEVSLKPKIEVKQNKSKESKSWFERLLP